MTASSFTIVTLPVLPTLLSVRSKTYRYRNIETVQQNSNVLAIGLRYVIDTFLYRYKFVDSAYRYTGSRRSQRKEQQQPVVSNCTVSITVVAVYGRVLRWAL